MSVCRFLRVSSEATFGHRPNPFAQGRTIMRDYIRELSAATPDPYYDAAVRELDAELGVRPRR